MTTFQKKLAFAMEQQLLKEQDNDVRDREDVMEHHIINVVTPSQDPDEGSLNISLPLPNSAPISESEIHSNVSFSVASESNPLVNTTATSIQLNNNFGPSSLSSVSSVAPNREFSPQGRYIKVCDLIDFFSLIRLININICSSSWMKDWDPDRTKMCKFESVCSIVCL